MGENVGRERILQRMRAALSAHSVQGHSTGAAADRGANLYISSVFAPIEDSLARFRAECEANRTELRLVTGENEADSLHKLLAQERQALSPSGGQALQEPSIFVEDAPELRRLMEGIDAPLRWSSNGPPQASDFAGVTLAEALVARTGSVFITTRQGGRAASVLPPVHIVYARLPQLVNEIGDALEQVQASGRIRDISMLSLITGPSRTSDIEKMLVLGAHGPRRLIVLLRL